MGALQPVAAALNCHFNSGLFLSSEEAELSLALIYGTIGPPLLITAALHSYCKHSLPHLRLSSRLLSPASLQSNKLSSALNLSQALVGPA